MSRTVAASLIFGVPIEERFAKDFDELALIDKDPSLYRHGNAFSGDYVTYLGFEMMEIGEEEVPKNGLPSLFEDITWRPKLAATWLKWLNYFQELYKGEGITVPEEIPDPGWYLLVYVC